MKGLLIAALVVDVPGVDVICPGGIVPSWLKLDPGDYHHRTTKWIRQVIVHTTKGNWPQHVKPGVGPHGRDQVVAEFWRGDPEHSAAQIVIGSDGRVACLCDLADVAAYHATVSNEWSVGIEVYQEADGGIYEAAIASLGLLVPVLCDALSIPFQIPTATYAGQPMKRMLNGGPDVVGVLGHRDNTDRRGRGDPGDLVFAELEARGAERLDFNAGEDLAVWKRRQTKLGITADGVCGPSTMAALRQRGCKSGRELDAAA